MKKLIITSVLLAVFFICNAQTKNGSQTKANMDFKTTKYKAGFSYYDNRGIKNTLLKWIKVDANLYRWSIKCEWMGVTELAWTDDCWIDVYTKKAYLNERTHKIVYYDTTIVR